ncbi:MAG: TldD/PmbA family protein, partial [Vallitaleaceae bacterium]|nr:TldD/PmbA family protein [Vallitaleaceae bacterium]
MMDKIIKLISTLEGVSAWKINEKTVHSEEIFFVKQKLDMNRSKKVHHYMVTLYVDFIENEQEYRGSSKTMVSSTMTEEELLNILKDVAFAASFVKNKHYNLPKPGSAQINENSSLFAKKPLSQWMPLISQAVFAEDQEELGWINSTEIFLNHIERRIRNSEGIDISYSNYVGEIEFITEWNEGKESVELFSILDFSEFKEDQIKSRVREMLQESRERALAADMPSLKAIPVILSGEAVKDLFKYYVNKTNVQMIYEKISSVQLEDALQGTSVSGDLLTIDLVPALENST